MVHALWIGFTRVWIGFEMEPRLMICRMTRIYDGVDTIQRYLLPYPALISISRAVPVHEYDKPMNVLGSTLLEKALMAI